MKIKKIILLTITLSFLIQPVFSQGYDRDAIFSAWKKDGAPGGLTILYPQNGTLFPPEFTPPTFKWKDSSDAADAWLIIAGLDGEKELFTEIRKEQEWKPDPQKWARIKQNSPGKDIKITVLGIKNNGSSASAILSGSSVTIRTSKDKVGGLIFFRSLPLPFAFARANLETVHWCLGDVSSETRPPIMLKDMPVCGNCHSFTPDGKTIAMDVDAMDDKGAYIVAAVEKDTIFDHDQIITWSDYQQKEPTMGLLSQISPDGRYVVSTLKDAEIFVALDDIEYSNFFFPIKGILVVYDRVTETYYPLPGADDSEYIQSNPNWTMDGKYIIFTRARAINREESGISFATLIREKDRFDKLLNDFKERKRRLYFDLYRIPFNNGRGGKAEPVPGASNNGVSNFFPRISPNGKWMVFTRAENFMLLQPDSQLFIMPANGSGKPRRMKCNTTNMNSWHSWSPNSKWLVFSSKAQGPYTQLYLTHIDENGNDSPAVLLENFRYPERAANIPEFVNIGPGEMERIVPKFLKNDSFLSYRNARVKAASGFLEDAVLLYDKAIEQNPGFYAAFTARGDAKSALGNLNGALADYNEAIRINPNSFRAFCKRGEVKIKLSDLDGASTDIETSIRLNNNFSDAYIGRGEIKIKTGDLDGAIADFNKAIELDPDSLAAFNKRALAKMKTKDFRGMLRDLDKCISINPKNAYLYFERGFAKTQLRDINGSITDFDTAVKLNPKYFQAYVRKGDAKFFLKDYKGAVDAYSEAIKLEPKIGPNYYKRGLANILTGQKAEGCRDLHKARELGVKIAADKIKQFCPE